MFAVATSPEEINIHLLIDGFNAPIIWSGKQVTQE
jgi:hypothetical protein